MSAEFVKDFTVSFNIRIDRYEAEDGSWMYDWLASNGDSPDVWFESAEEAERDARGHFE